MKTKILYLIFLLSAVGLLVQCKAKRDTGYEDDTAPSADKMEKVSPPNKEVLSKVLTKEKGEHADDIVELTPEFIKAVQQYEVLGAFSEGLAAVRKGDKWGYINTKGEVVIPTTIDAACVGRFSEGLAFVNYCDYFCLIDTEGKTVFKSNVNDGGFCRVYYECDSWWGLVDNMPYYINGKLYVREDYGNDHVYDNRGNKITDEGDKQYDEILEHQDSLQNPYQVLIDEKEGEYYWLGIKDLKGKIIIPARYGYIDDTLSNGVFLVGYYDGWYPGDGPPPAFWGFVDLKGNDTFPEDIKRRFGRR